MNTEDFYKIITCQLLKERESYAKMSIKINTLLQDYPNHKEQLLESQSRLIKIQERIIKNNCEQLLKKFKR